MGLAEDLLKHGMYRTRDPAAANRLGRLLIELRKHGFDPDKIDKKKIIQKMFPFPQILDQPTPEPKPPRKPYHRSAYIQKKLFE